MLFISKKLKFITLFLTLILIFSISTPIALAVDTPYGSYEIVEPAINLNLCPDTPTNLTEENYETLLLGTELAGLGSAYVKGETDTGMNGLFILAVNCLESGYGTSYLSRNSNNIGGVKAGDSGYKQYESKEECIGDIFRFVSSNYNLDSIESVGRTYCQPMENWAVQVQSIMNDFIEELQLYID